jgi:hypothetical protein
MQLLSAGACETHALEERPVGPIAIQLPATLGREPAARTVQPREGTVGARAPRVGPRPGHEHVVVRGPCARPPAGERRWRLATVPHRAADVLERRRRVHPDRQIRRADQAHDRAGGRVDPLTPPPVVEALAETPELRRRTQQRHQSRGRVLEQRADRGHLPRDDARRMRRRRRRRALRGEPHQQCCHQRPGAPPAQPTRRHPSTCPAHRSSSDRSDHPSRSCTSCE